MKDTISCFFQVSGEMEPSQISFTLNLGPTEVFRKGDVKRRDKRGIHPDVLYNENFWLLESALDSSAPEEDHLDAMLELLASRESALIELANTCHLTIEIYGKKQNPHVGVYVGREQTKLLGSLGIALGISVYVLGESQGTIS